MESREVERLRHDTDHPPAPDVVERVLDALRRPSGTAAGRAFLARQDDVVPREQW